MEADEVYLAVIEFLFLRFHVTQFSKNRLDESEISRRGGGILKLWLYIPGTDVVRMSS